MTLVEYRSREERTQVTDYVVLNLIEAPVREYLGVFDPDPQARVLPKREEFRWQPTELHLTYSKTSSDTGEHENWTVVAISLRGRKLTLAGKVGPNWHIDNIAIPVSREVERFNARQWLEGADAVNLVWPNWVPEYVLLQVMYNWPQLDGALMSRIIAREQAGQNRLLRESLTVSRDGYTLVRVKNPHEERPVMASTPRTLTLTFEFRVAPDIAKNIQLSSLQRAIDKMEAAMSTIATDTMPWAEKMLVDREWNYTWWRDNPDWNHGEYDLHRPTSPTT